MTWKSSEGVGTGYFSNIFGVFRLSYPRFSDDVFFAFYYQNVAIIFGFFLVKQRVP